MTPDLWKLVIVLVFTLLVIGFGMSMEVHRRNAALDVVKKAIERGQALDPKLANALTGQREFDPRTLLFPGIMTIALSVGISGASLIWDRPKLLAAGFILLCIGAALILSSKILPRPAKGGIDLSSSN